MFNRPPHLSFRRPSPTTVLFTVSNAPSRATISSRVLFYLELLLRCILGICVLFVDAAKGRNGVFFQDDSLSWDLLWETSPGMMACSIADRMDWRLLGAVSFALVYLVFRKGYTGQLINPGGR
jgi:phosphatidylinositol N-acetylglucosaminyltransferase subunit H